MMPLAPEHVEDLKRSGLSDSTIAALSIAAVRPADIPVKAAASAYKIPYFNLNGMVNCFARLKLVPPVKDASGHSMKYWQEPGSGPHLYCPPLLNWKTVARNSSTILTITEGEKKAAAGCQAGVIAAGIGGVWCWTSTLDNGDRLALPMLDEFVWTNRLVLLCPDSDAWREGKERDILGGFFALGKALQQRGATVQFVIIPDLHSAKTGLDDWLLIPGNNENSWENLQRVSIDDSRFSKLTAWWQRWKERQATQEALRERVADDLSLTEVAGLYTVRSPKHGVAFTFDRLTDQSGSFYAELTVRLGSTDLLDAVDLNLKSDTAHAKHANSLKTFSAGIPWKLLVQKACALVLRHYRTGPPLLTITAATPVEHVTYSVNPMVFKKKTTILYGDGGLGKSSLALLIGMNVSVGQSVAGFQALRGRVLFLDYEDDEHVHTQRFQALLRGHIELAGAEVSYQRCVEPLTRLTHGLARLVQAHGITFLVLDSIMAATGGDSSAEAATKLFAALRMINVECLALGHVPKAQSEGQDHQTVYGSVFHQNFARSVWELKKQQDVGEDRAVIGLFHRKSNLSRLHLPIGLAVNRDAGGTLLRYEPFDLSQAAELEQALPIAARIRNLLESDGIPRSAKEITLALGEKQATIQATLSKHKGVKWQMIGDNRTAKWTVITR